MSEFTIYHNPRCSKSRAALELLAGRGIDLQVVPYLDQIPSIAQIGVLVQQLGFADARQLMRQGEAEYKELGLDDPALSQDALIAALAENPRLIERPIFVRGNRAVIGRPPERVLELL